MTDMTIDVQPGESAEAIRLKIEVARLKAEVEALRAKKGRAATQPGMKVSPKGALSVYGLGRFPITLYKAQWHRLLEMADRIREFLKDHDAELTTKEDESPEEKAEREAHNLAQIETARRQRTPAAR